jgi:low affinity Fe/Cu permease
MADTQEPNPLVYSEHSNRDLIEAIIKRLNQHGPSRQKAIAVTHLHTALLWLGAEADRLP